MKTLRSILVSSFFVFLAIEKAEKLFNDVLQIDWWGVLIRVAFAIVLVVMVRLLKIPVKSFMERIKYGESFDKMNFIVKCFKWINANKKSIVGTVGALLTSVATAYATYGGYFDFLPKLMVGEFDFMALIVGVVCFALVELGVTGKGFETIKAFGDRITARKEQKAQEKINAEARAEIKAEEKLASLNQEKQEKAKAKAEAEALAKQAKEQAEKEHREKVEAVKLAMKAEAETKNQSLAQ